MSQFAGQKFEIAFPAGCTNSEAREKLHIFNLLCEAKINGMMESSRKEALQKETSAEAFVQQVEFQLQAKAHGVERFSNVVNAPPGLAPKMSSVALWEALKYYKKLLASEARERTVGVGKAQKQKEKEDKAKEQVASMTAEEVLETKFRAIAEEVHLGNKNGKSPGAAPGQNQKNGKSKGKGKGKNVEQKGGNCKSKPQPNNWWPKLLQKGVKGVSKSSGKGSKPNKGKGKGKGKHQ